MALLRNSFVLATLVVACSAPFTRGADASPQFGRQVVAVLDRLGCNAGACHGSFRGQNGFRLSLFGSDADMDYHFIARDSFGRRINLGDAEQSLLLLKATGRVAHGGGTRMRGDSSEYRLVRDWIAAGARFDPASEPPLTRLHVSPGEAVLTPRARQAQLRVEAVYADGTRADVTALSRFETLNDEVAVVDRDGRIVSRGMGDTPILVRHAGQVAAVQVLVPRPGQLDEPAARAVYSSAGFVDEEINAKLRKLRMTPSVLCSDGEFLRRVGFDLVGSLPTPAEVRAFVADKRADKRTRKIDELLERPEYAAFWATRFSDWTGNDTRYLANPYRPKQSKQWHDWLRDKLARNVPYNEIATGVLTATSCEEKSPAEWQTWAKAEEERLKGKEWNFEYAKRKTLDLLYVKARNLDPDSLALQMAYCFLGVKIECAQCHKHPMDRWTQSDFGAFASAFTYVGVSREFDRKALPLEEAANNGMRGINEVFCLETPRKVYTDPKSGQPLRPKALGGPELPVGKDHDPRVALSRWLTAPENPFFARALVNRLWAHYFGHGLVEPSDALAAANPASHPALLDELARRFADKYDLKMLHRTLLSSHTYQRSSQANETNRADRRNFSHALVRRLGAEQVVDAVAQATGVPAQFAAADAPPGSRAIEVAPSRLTGADAYALTIFGRPQRQQNCDCERSDQPSLPQTLYLFNDAELLNKISKPDARLAKLLTELPDDAKLVEELYLAALARFPASVEQAAAVRYLKEGERRERAQDLFWALLNHREFLVNY